MELYIKGKFSNKERFEIYDEMKSVRYMVMAEFGFGHKIHIYDAYDKEIGYLESYTEKLMTQYRLYDEDGYIDSLLHKFSFKKSQYRLEKLNWKISATNFWETHFDFTCDGEKIGEIRTIVILFWADFFAISASCSPLSLTMTELFIFCPMRVESRLHPAESTGSRN